MCRRNVSLIQQHYTMSEYINHCLKGAKMFELVRCKFSSLGCFTYSDKLRDIYSSPNIFMLMKYMSWVKAEIHIEFW
jgi:hypothetical protein